MNETVKKQQQHSKQGHKARRQKSSLLLLLISILFCTIAIVSVLTLMQEESSQEQQKTLEQTNTGNNNVSNTNTSNTNTSNTNPEIKTPTLRTSDHNNPSSEGWNLVLVNPWHAIPDDLDITLIQLKNGQSVDERIYPDLQEMMDDCRAAGLSPIICSSYRTMDKQARLFNNQVKNYQSQGYSEEDAVIEAGKWVATPGTSEHQLGLAVDIVAVSNQNLDQSQENTSEQQWLMENSYKYGFILRYPTDKSEITGIGYEPWHYRFVGKEVAAEIKERGICLEEYLEAK
ncbi:M15 family metallopeptidase [Rubeoparvulum massiliense]|uniref:M15 family metallopeptidase n=1 Tax=Rubeoparvulum massiliense TaxID=1631346 RepID=UPI00069EF7BB|nr:M15 family metallopeptidase [Rubeoparvulum massiliense]